MGLLVWSYEDMFISTVLLPSTHMPSATLGGMILLPANTLKKRRVPNPSPEQVTASWCLRDLNGHFYPATLALCLTVQLPDSLKNLGENSFYLVHSS